MTASSSVTSAAIESSPGEPSTRSTPTTIAPSSSNSRADSAPMPPAAPVITHTLPASRSGIGLVVHGFQLGVVVERVGPELATDTGLLETAEGRGDAHTRVGVDRDHAGLDRAGGAESLGAVARPDGAAQTVDRVVRQLDALGLAAEREHAGDRAEDLLGGGARVAVRRLEHGG